MRCRCSRHLPQHWAIGAVPSAKHVRDRLHNAQGAGLIFTPVHHNVALLKVAVTIEMLAKHIQCTHIAIDVEVRMLSSLLASRAAQWEMDGSGERSPGQALAGIPN